MNKNVYEIPAVELACHHIHKASLAIAHLASQLPRSPSLAAFERAQDGLGHHLHVQQ